MRIGTENELYGGPTMRQGLREGQASPQVSQPDLRTAVGDEADDVVHRPYALLTLCRAAITSS